MRKASKGLAVIACIWVALVLVSLKYGFLEKDVMPGLDFFQVPAAFRNLTAGSSLFLSELGTYLPHGTPYFNHPFLAVVVGPWTSWFTPNIAYTLFIDFSVVIFFACASLLSFTVPTSKALSYFLFLSAPSVYIMLIVGNMHIFVVLAVSLIIAGLIHLEQEPDSRYTRWVQAGILISLLSKPVVLLMLPALFLLPETRRKIIMPLSIYACVSVLFLLVPGLNPGGYNATHWLNLFKASCDSSHSFWLSNPTLQNSATSFGFYSLPRLLAWHCSRTTLSAITAVPLVVILTLSLSLPFLSDRNIRIRAAIVIVILCVLSHFLCYFLVLMYHYATVIPVLLALLWLRNGETGRRRHILTAAVIASSCVLLPLPQAVISAKNDAWLCYTALHVASMGAAFILIAAYGAMSVWGHMRFAMPSRRLVERPVAGGLLLAGVFAIAFATAPSRLLVSPTKWTWKDWADHYEDITRHPGIRPDMQFKIHRQLAIGYAHEDLTRSLQHYQAAFELTDRHDALTVEMADVLMTARAPEQAQKLLSRLQANEITEPKVKARYYQLERALSSIVF